MNSEDRKRLERFTNSLVLKTVQVIVQSRLGEKVKTYSSRSSSSTDWFNLAIYDESDVQIETKKALAGQIPNFEDSLCIEISLTTVEGDILVLETWCLGMNEKNDPTVKVLPTVYNRIGLMLKSLIAVSRVTPAYKLSCRQGEDTYVICYKVYLGNAQYHLLGDGYEENIVGQVVTPVGTLILSVAYRTNLTITPQQTEKGCTFAVKSDYFKKDLTPKSHYRHSYDSSVFYTDLRNGFCENGDDTAHICHSPTSNRCHPYPHSVNSGDSKLEQNENVKDVKANRTGRHFSFNESKVGAFVPNSKISDATLLPDLVLPDTPFLSLVQNDDDNNPICKNFTGEKKDKNFKDTVDKNANMASENKNVINNTNNLTSKKYEKIMDHNSNPRECNYHKSTGNDGSTYDFVMVELKPSFADRSSNNDLGAFFRECQSAPPLNSFANQPSLEEQVVEINKQLAMFETNLQDFDDFIDSICHTELHIG